jgi:hypothetical protein
MEGSGLSKVQVLRGALAAATRGSEPARPRASSLERAGGTVQEHLHVQVRPFKSSRMDGCERPKEGHTPSPGRPERSVALGKGVALASNRVADASSGAASDLRISARRNLSRSWRLFAECSVQPCIKQVLRRAAAASLAQPSSSPVAASRRSRCRCSAVFRATGTSQWSSTVRRSPLIELLDEVNSSALRWIQMRKWSDCFL